MAQAEVAVSAATEGGAIAAASFTDTNVSNIRKVIATKLTESKTTVPHYYLTVDVDLTLAQELRKKFNAGLAASGSKLSINDFVLKASALAMKKVRRLNTVLLPFLALLSDGWCASRRRHSIITQTCSLAALIFKGPRGKQLVAR